MPTASDTPDAFGRLHPAVIFAYFCLVILITALFLHPFTVVCSLAAALSYAVLLRGVRALRFFLVFMLPLAAFTAILNPLFNHAGQTIVAYLPGGNPLTLEAILYGVTASGMLAAVVGWFYCYQVVMTSDKLILLFGRTFPVLTLLLSMALRFVPRFVDHFRAVREAQRTLRQANEPPEKGKRALKAGAGGMTALITWAGENAIVTADSMRNRGYGLPGRTHYSPARFVSRDARALAGIFAFAGLTGTAAWAGGLYWVFYPALTGAEAGWPGLIARCAFLLLCLVPLLINGEEALRWKFAAWRS